MIRFLLNNLFKAPGHYWVEGSSVYRSLPLNMNYICYRGESPEEAKRIAFQLSQLRTIK